MDAGTDAMDMLLNRVIPLRLGYIGVINRSQQDIIKKKPIRSALKAEADFFATHPLYRSVAGRCGTPFLSKTLNKILMNHIKDCLPELKAKINKMANDAQSELLTYGDPLYEGKNSQGALLLQIITKFSTDYKNAIEGKSTDLSLSELCGGARINYIFNDIFARCLTRINPNDDMTLNDIRTAIRNATGPRASLFVPEAAFELLVRRQIQRLEDPSLQCVDLVYDELQRIISQLEFKELLRFVNLRERVVEVVNQLLQKCRVPTKTMISNVIAVELSYINTNHPDFVGGGGAITQVFERMAATHAQEQQMLMQQQQAMYAQQQAQQQQQGMGQAQPQPQQPPPQPQPQPQVNSIFFTLCWHHANPTTMCFSQSAPAKQLGRMMSAANRAMASLTCSLVARALSHRALSSSNLSGCRPQHPSQAHQGKRPPLAPPPRVVALEQRGEPLQLRRRQRS